MKKLIWFAAGIAIGTLAVKQLEENPKAQEFVKEARDRAKDFGAAVSEGFREREAEIIAENMPKKPSAAKRAPSTSAKTTAE